ncbi:MAG: hypothetical protein LH471_07600 [Salinibacterium sp.]|nr:hypothetical protein [Salinibacterium sp.]
MEPLLFAGAIIAIATLGFIAQRFGWIDLSNKSKTGATGGGSALGIGDEVFHPTRHEAQIELDRQTVLPAPAPLAGDSDRGVYQGKVEIDLDADGGEFKRSRE